MPRINANQAQARYHINRSTVGRWIKAGRIAADAFGDVDEAELVAAGMSKFASIPSGGAAAPSSSAAPAKAEAKKEEAKVEVEPEVDVDMGDLFGY